MAQDFEYWMNRERAFAQEEYAAVARNDYAAADSAHKQRWNCLEVALRIAEASNGETKTA